MSIDVKKILIIDDDDNIRQFAADVLTAEGYYVIEADSAEKGLSILLGRKKKQAETFEVVICDIMMPGADGFEVLKKLRKSKKEVPVFIYITAMKERKDLRKAMEAGADDFISKPFMADELIRAVKIQTEKKEKLINTYSINRAVTNDDEKSQAEEEIQALDYSGNIFIDNGKKAKFINVSDIVIIKSVKDYTLLHSANREHYYIRKPLKNWIHSLPEEHFLQANRSELINLNYAVEIIKLANNTHEAVLKNYDKKISISRRVSIKLRNKLKTI